MASDFVAQTGTGPLLSLLSPDMSAGPFEVGNAYGAAIPGLVWFKF